MNAASNFREPTGCPPAAGAGRPFGHPAARTPARILLVDDDADLRTIIADMLSAGENQVVTAVAGPGLSQILDDGPYDLVVTDLRMPELSGWDVARMVRERNPTTPVLAIGGDVGERPGDPTLEAFDAVLGKPFRTAALLAVVDGVLSRARTISRPRIPPPNRRPDEPDRPGE